MNDQQIYQLMAMTPDITAVKIADTLDQELVDVSAALRVLVEVGDVRQHSGIGKNGRGVQMYNLTDEFKRSREYGVVQALNVGAQASAVPAPEKQTSKIDKGVAYVLLHGLASDDELRKVMDLKKIDYPSVYLKTATTAGRIHKGDKGWVPGKKPAAQARAPFNITVAKPKGEVKAQFGPTAQPDDVTKDDVKDLPQAVVEQLSKPAQALTEACKHDTPYQYHCKECDLEYRPKTTAPINNEPSPFDEPVFRCGLWSDGVLELQRNGRSLVELTRGEGEQMAEFVNRMLGAAAEKVAA